jgi:DNA replication and repair protein RecF
VILTQLSVSGARNIDHIELRPGRRINWIIGPNGAGKTTLLEAVFLLARGRSFRGARHGPIRGRGTEILHVAARFRLEQGATPERSIRFVQDRHDSHYLENGRRLGGVRELRDRLHVRLIADNAQQLLEGPPRIRRLFLDWNLFHVEPGYPRLLSELRRVRSQRNAWLQHGARGPAVWDAPYCRLAQEITTRRATLVDDLSDGLRQQGYLTERFGSAPQLEYRRGWPEHASLQDLLRDSLRQDQERGYTFYGPPRADFAVRFGHGSAVPSRGQTKLLVFCLQLAVQACADRRHGPPAVWLLDDLAAELDRPTVKQILDDLLDTGSQVFVTAVSEGVPPRDTSTDPAHTLFHVEQGALSGSANPPAFG